MMMNETDNSRRFKNLISTAQLVKKIAQHGYEGIYTEQAIYMLLKKYGVTAKTSRGGKSYFNKKNACECIDRHIFELKELAERLEAQNNGQQDEPEWNVGYGREDMSVASREQLANDGVFGADENELYRTNESKKIIRISEDKIRLFDINVKKKLNITEQQYDRLFEGVSIRTVGDGNIGFNINQNASDIDNKNYADTRFFGTRGDIANGDGTYKRGYKNSIIDEYKSILGAVNGYKCAIRIMQHKWYNNADALISKSGASGKAKTTLLNLIFNKQLSDDEKLERLNGGLNRAINKLNVIQGKYDRVNQTIKNGKPGRPARISNSTILPRYNVGYVPNTSVKLIALFELNDFNFSDAIKHGNMRPSDDTEKYVGPSGSINKLGKGYQKEKVGVVYDNGILPNIAGNFSLNGIYTDPFDIDKNGGHYKQQYGYDDEKYTSVAQFMDKSIMAAAYAIKKENVQVDYIIDAPSSSMFNHYYCTNLSNKLGVEYRQGFFQRSMLNVKLDEYLMRKNGINEKIIQNTKIAVRNIAIAEITSYMNDCVKKFVNDNFSYLNNISLERSSRLKIDAPLLIDFIREQAYYGLLNVKKENPKTTNLYMYLVNHFGAFKKDIRSTKFNTEHISNEIGKILRTRLSRKYQILLGEIDNITKMYEQQLLTNGMKLSSKKKFKITDIDENARPYVRNAYVVADSEMAHNKNGIIDKLRASLQNKHFLIIDEDMQSGATLYLLINALKDKELECGDVERGPGRPKRNIINDNQITCLVNAIKK